jgi:hypothetical protein
MSRLIESTVSFIMRKNSKETKRSYRRALILFGQIKFSDVTPDETFKNLILTSKKPIFKWLSTILINLKTFSMKKNGTHNNPPLHCRHEIIVYG